MSATGHGRGRPTSEGPAKRHHRRDLHGQQPGQSRGRVSRNWTDNGTSLSTATCPTRWLRTTWPKVGDSCVLLGGNNLNFGNPNATDRLSNPAILGGWGVRPLDWQLGASIHRRFAPRVSVNVGYNRRWLGTSFVADTLCTMRHKWTFGFLQVPGAAGQRQYADLRQHHSPRRPHVARAKSPDDLPRAARTQARRGRQPATRGSQRVQAGTTTGRGVQNTVRSWPSCQSPWRSGTGPMIDSCDVTEPFVTTLTGSPAYAVPKWTCSSAPALCSVPTAVLLNGIDLRLECRGRRASNSVVQQTLGRLRERPVDRHHEREHAGARCRNWAAGSPKWICGSPQDRPAGRQGREPRLAST